MTKTRSLVLLYLAGTLLFGRPLLAQDSPASAPSLPVIDYNACPFEGCTFGKWIVTRETSLFSTWREGREALGVTLKKEQIVTGLTGVHITYEPDRILIREAIPELRVQPGDIILRYMYHGEGFCDLWAKGQWKKEYDCTFITELNHGGCLRDCAATASSEGKKEWWVQVKTPQGATGWSKAEGQFDCMDSLGGEPKCGKLQSNSSQDSETPK